MDNVIGFSFKKIFKESRIQSLKKRGLDTIVYASEILKYVPSITITKTGSNQFFNNVKNMVVLK